METNHLLIEPLLEKAEQYGKTSFELFKLKSIGKLADLSSLFISRLLLVLVLFIFVITINIAIALWLGEILGKNYYGFLIVSLFYGLTGIILMLVHPAVKTFLNNRIITEVLN